MYGIPPLSSNYMNELADCIPTEFPPIKIDTSHPFMFTKQPLYLERAACWRYVENGELVCKSLFKLSYALNDVIYDAAKALQAVFCTFSDQWTSLFSLLPDIFVVMRTRQPLGIIQVFIPSDDTILDNSHVHGQIHDHMLYLKHYYGVEDGFGIVTTYKQWRVFWLSDSNNVANSDREDYIPPRQETANVESEEPFDENPTITVCEVKPIPR